MKTSREISTNNNVVCTSGLNHHFNSDIGKSQILFDLNFSIKEAEVVLLRGPSGCGKSTLLTLVAGLRKVQTGSLKVFDTELNGANENQLLKVRRRIGFIFQAHNLHDSLTAIDNVKIGLEVSPEIPRESRQLVATQILEKVDLGNRITYYPNELSGGQKQRVAVARALAGKPKLILADEPTAALDGKTGRQVVELIRELAKEQGAAALIVTHDDRITDLADRIISMEDGRILSQVEHAELTN